VPPPGGRLNLFRLIVSQTSYNTESFNFTCLAISFIFGKQGTCEYQFYKTFGLTRRGNRIPSTARQTLNH